MGTPASNGKLCTKLSDMSIGDYIRCEYIAPTAGIAGTFQNLGGESVLPEIPLVLTSLTSNDGHFYFIKVDKGLLVADRNVQIVSQSELNKANYITGKFVNSMLFRSLSLKERIKYITNSDLNSNITKQDNNVWHIYAYDTTQDRVGGTFGVCNGFLENNFSFSQAYTYFDVGNYRFCFRPVLEFVENSKSTNIWY